MRTHSVADAGHFSPLVPTSQSLYPSRWGPNRAPTSMSVHSVSLMPPRLASAGFDNVMAKVQAWAFRWRKLLETGAFATVEEIAAAENITASYVIRRECLDNIIIWSAAHLRRVRDGYVPYYNTTRTHLGLRKDAPSRTVRLETAATRSPCDDQGRAGGAAHDSFILPGRCHAGWIGEVSEINRKVGQCRSKGAAPVLGRMTIVWHAPKGRL